VSAEDAVEVLVLEVAWYADWVGVTREEVTEPMSKLPSLSSVTVMFAFAALISRLRDDASADSDEVTRLSGILHGGDKECGIEG